MAAIVSDIKYYFTVQGSITSVFNLGFWSLLLYRLGSIMHQKKIYKIILVWYVYLIFKNLLILFSKIELPPSSKIGKNFNLVHAYGLVMGDKVIIGDNCTIGPWVVIGHNGSAEKQPVIGDGIYVGAHACILGQVKIGDNSLIGANTVVTKDIPSNSVVKTAAVTIRQKY